MPMGTAPIQQGTVVRQWAAQRFSCCDDIGICFFGWCCGCIMFGQNMEKAKLMSCGGGACLLIAPILIGWLIGTIVSTIADVNLSIFFDLPAWLLSAYVGFKYRKEILTKYNIQPWEGDCQEFLCWWCCSCCSVIQEYRTLLHNVDYNGDWMEPQQQQPVGAQPSYGQPQPNYGQPQPMVAAQVPMQQQGPPVYAQDGTTKM